MDEWTDDGWIAEYIDTQMDGLTDWSLDGRWVNGWTRRWIYWTMDREIYVHMDRWMDGRQKHLDS